MLDIHFEWDDWKAKINRRKHGISFEQAKAVFDDRSAAEFLDDRMSYGEDRFILIGKSATGLLAVVYTEYNGTHRIISARKATPNERRRYIARDTRAGR